MILNKYFMNWRYKVIESRIPKGSVVCDLGCGRDPIFLKRIKKNIKKGYGFDKFSNGWEEGNLETKRLDLEQDKVPLEDNSVDVVVIVAVLGHLEKHELIMNESYRILKKGGVLVITNPSKWVMPLHKLFINLNLLVDSYINFKNCFSKEEMKMLLSNSGFEYGGMETFQFGLNRVFIAEKN